MKRAQKERRIEGGRLVRADPSHVVIFPAVYLRRTRNNGRAVSSRVDARDISPTSAVKKQPPDLLITLIGAGSPAIDCHASNMSVCQVCRPFDAFPDAFYRESHADMQRPRRRERHPMMRNGELPVRHRPTSSII
jgi:hypothetical protein